jgi:hypothetical protein
MRTALLAVLALAACGGRNSDGSPQTLPPSPPSAPPHTLVLSADAFGPPSARHALVGVEWYQWLSGGNFAPRDRFDVRVVVHRGLSLAAVQARYPVIRGRADHRYVAYEAALQYLDAEERSLAGERDGPLARLASELRETRARIVKALGVP